MVTQRSFLLSQELRTPYSKKRDHDSKARIMGGGEGRGGGVVLAHRRATRRHILKVTNAYAFFVFVWSERTRRGSLVEHVAHGFSRCDYSIIFHFVFGPFCLFHESGTRQRSSTMMRAPARGTARRRTPNASRRLAALPRPNGRDKSNLQRAVNHSFYFCCALSATTDIDRQPTTPNGTNRKLALQ